MEREYSSKIHEDFQEAYPECVEMTTVSYNIYLIKYLMDRLQKAEEK